MPALDTLLELGEAYGVWAGDIVREVEEARRSEDAARGAGDDGDGG